MYNGSGRVKLRELFNPHTRDHENFRPDCNENWSTTSFRNIRRLILVILLMASRIEKKTEVVACFSKVKGSKQTKLRSGHGRSRWHAISHVIVARGQPRMVSQTSIAGSTRIEWCAAWWLPQWLCVDDACRHSCPHNWGPVSYNTVSMRIHQLVASASRQLVKLLVWQ